MSGYRVAVFPGSFDPVTNGHINIIRQASRDFDVVHVLIAPNADKTPLLSADDRKTIIGWEIDPWQMDEHLRGKSLEILVTVMAHDDLTVLTAERLGARHVIRGVRNASDWSYEQSLQHTFAELSAEYGVPELSFHYYGAPLDNQIFTSSTLVRGLMKSRDWKKSIRRFVPESTITILERRLDANAAKVS